MIIAFPFGCALHFDVMFPWLQRACVVGGVTVRLDSGIRLDLFVGDMLDAVLVVARRMDEAQPPALFGSHQNHSFIAVLPTDKGFVDLHRAPEHAADRPPRCHGGARRSPISPGTRAVRVCASRETTCPTSGSSDGRMKRIRKVYRRAPTGRSRCYSDRSAAVVSAARGKVFAARLFRSKPLLKLKQCLGKITPKPLLMRLCHLDISLISRKHSHVAGLKRRGMGRR